MRKRIFALLMALSLSGLLSGCFYSLGIGTGGVSIGGGGYFEDYGGDRGDPDRGGRNGGRGRGSGYERRGGDSGGGEAR